MVYMTHLHGSYSKPIRILLYQYGISWCKGSNDKESNLLAISAVLSVGDQTHKLLWCFPSAICCTDEACLALLKEENTELKVRMVVCAGLVYSPGRLLTCTSSARFRLVCATKSIKIQYLTACIAEVRQCIAVHLISKALCKFLYLYRRSTNCWWAFLLNSTYMYKLIVMCSWQVCKSPP